MAKKQKKTAWAVEPRIEKRAIPAHWPTVAESSEQFSWRFGSIDRNFPNAWSTLSASTVSAIHGFLADLEKKTWAEACRGGYPVKMVKLAEAPTRVQTYLESINRDDTDDLVQMHLGGLPRLWGVRRANVCHLMWWDPGHQVWPSAKKHT